jgi:SAM-dependent methyltransferase
MTTEATNPYDRVPYESHAYGLSAPDAMARTATLFGMEPASPERCRVLEIGCAAGGNIGPLAYLYPESTFVGIDLSRVQIEQGRRFLEPLGLKNIELTQHDIMDVGEDFGHFDYIICHGVYSWVADPVRDRLLAVCRDHLAPQGVAYVSYNTYPGWHMTGMIRDMMLYHTATLTDPVEKVNQARALLDFLAEAYPEDAKTPYAVLLRREAKRLGGLADSYLFHDHLEEHNAPVYFHQFIERAQAHDLNYLGESHLPVMLPMHLPAHTQEILKRIGDDLYRVEQYMDFVRNRGFRASLLVHDARQLERHIEWPTMTQFYYGCKGKFEEEPGDLGSGAQVTVIRKESRLTTTTPLLKAAFQVLFSTWPRSLSFDELLGEALALLGSSEEGWERAVLGGGLLNCHASNVVEVRATPARVGGFSDRPTASRWVQAQIEGNATRLTNLRHGPCCSCWTARATTRKWWRA